MLFYCPSNNIDFSIIYSMSYHVLHQMANIMTSYFPPKYFLIFYVLESTKWRRMSSYIPYFYLFSFYIFFGLPPYQHNRLTDRLQSLSPATSPAPLPPTGAHKGFGQRCYLACGSKQDGRMSPGCHRAESGVEWNGVDRMVVLRLWWEAGVVKNPPARKTDCTGCSFSGFVNMDSQAAMGQRVGL